MREQPECVSIQITNNVATITIENGKANAISHQVIEQLNLALDQAEQQGCVVVITGQSGVFSAGYDLKVMTKSHASAVALVNQGSLLAKRLFEFPLPVVMAASGHAVAKGGFLLLAADYRVGVEGEFKIGLNEVAIGIPMHFAGIEIARYRIPKGYFSRVVNLAEMLSPTQAIAAGFLDEAVAPEELLSRAQKLAESFSQLDPKAYALTKQKGSGDFLHRLEQAIQRDLD